MSDTIKDLEIATQYKNDYINEGNVEAKHGRQVSRLTTGFFAMFSGCLQIERATHVYDGLYTLIAVNSLGESNMSVEAQFHKGLRRNSLAISFWL